MSKSSSPILGFHPVSKKGAATSKQLFLRTGTKLSVKLGAFGFDRRNAYFRINFDKAFFYFSRGYPFKRSRYLSFFFRPLFVFLRSNFDKLMSTLSRFIKESNYIQKSSFTFSIRDLVIVYYFSDAKCLQYYIGKCVKIDKNLSAFWLYRHTDITVGRFFLSSPALLMAKLVKKAQL